LTTGGGKMQRMGGGDARLIAAPDRGKVRAVVVGAVVVGQVWSGV